MQPLMEPGVYDRLRALRDRMPEQGVPANRAHVFVPVEPEGRPPESNALGVLIVGRATRGFGGEEVATYEAALGEARRVVDAHVPAQGTPKRSDFWRFSRAVVRAALDKLGASPSARLSDHLGWSNLAKIGDTKGDATPRSLALQAQLCQEALRSEMAAMRPHAVVVVTGDYAKHEVFWPVFGADGWRSERANWTEWRWKAGVQGSPLVVWTEYPRARPDLAEAAMPIGAKIAAAVAAVRTASA